MSNSLNQLLQEDNCTTNTMGFWESQIGGTAKLAGFILWGKTYCGSLGSEPDSCLGPLVQM